MNMLKAIEEVLKSAQKPLSC
ncbi:MAG: hypothetical protein UZ16_OP3001001891, partial [Candidatus Hinthialibacteria bacterium OLB16]